MSDDRKRVLDESEARFAAYMEAFERAQTVTNARFAAMEAKHSQAGKAGE